MERSIIINKISKYLCCNIDIAELYINILEKPLCFENAVANECELDKGLQVLIEKCLISDYVDERNGGKKFYFAIDPQYSLSALLLAEMWKRDSNFHSLEVLKINKGNDDLYSKYMLLKNILSDIQGIYKRQLPYMREIIFVVKGKEKIASSIAEQISDTQHNIHAIMSPPQLMGEIVWQTVVEKMNSGVKYNRITDFEEIVRHGVEISRLEIENYNEVLYIFLGGELPEKFYIFDEQNVVFFEKNINKRKYLKKIQIVRNAGVACQFLGRYNAILDNTLNFNEIVPKVYKYRGELLQTVQSFLDEKTIEWLTDIFDYGVFYSKGKYDSEFIEQAIAQCVEKGIVRALYDGTIVVNYGIGNIL